MPSVLRALATAFAVLIAATGCTTAAGSGTSSPVDRVGERSLQPLLDPAWRSQMAAGLDAWALGDRDAATRHYRAALRRARSEGLSEQELAFSSYRLGDAIRLRPGSARGESAIALLEESRRHFERAYGPDHPVLIPVWIRISEIQQRAGDEAASAASRARADRIARRAFPASHFLRERYGDARPAALLHPLEVLSLLGTSDPSSDRVVQGP